MQLTLFSMPCRIALLSQISALRFDPTTTPGDMSRQVSPGDMVRVGTAILNDLQVGLLKSGFLAAVFFNLFLAHSLLRI